MVGASNWLNAISLAEHGFNLSKGEFRDILALRFNHDIKGLPSRGGFVIMRHNDITDFEAHLSKKVYSDGEREKKRAYNERIINVEQGTHTPLVFTVLGEWARKK